MSIIWPYLLDEMRKRRKENSEEKEREREKMFPLLFCINNENFETFVVGCASSHVFYHHHHSVVFDGRHAISRKSLRKDTQWCEILLRGASGWKNFIESRISFWINPSPLHIVRCSQKAFFSCVNTDGSVSIFTYGLPSKRKRKLGCL